MNSATVNKPENLPIDDVYIPDEITFSELEADKKTYSNKRFNKNIYMPDQPAAMLFTGPRGSHKTTTMLNLIDQMDYDTLTIFSSTLNQPKFQQIVRNKEELEKKLDMDLSDVIRFEDDLSIILDGTFINSRDISQHHLVIVDDFAVSDDVKNKAFAQLVLNGRPKGITCLISTQSFYTIEKKIRENITHFIFLRGIINRDIKRIATEYINDCSPDDFVAMYNVAMRGVVYDANNNKINLSSPMLVYDKMTNIAPFMFRINFMYLAGKVNKTLE